MTIEELKIWINNNCFNTKKQFNPFPITKNREINNLVLNLTLFLDHDAKISQRCWHIVTDMYEIPTCLHCNKKLKFKRFSLGYGFYCGNLCCTKSTHKKIKCEETCLDRYGVKSPQQTEKIKEQVKQTKLEKYGNENYNNIEKNKETKFLRYGDENYNNREQARETCLENYGVVHYTKTKKYKIDTLKYNIEKYGVSCTLHYPEFQFKVKQTNLKKYGVENCSQREDIKTKKEETCLRNFGVKHNLQRKETRYKLIESVIKKYGVPYYLQNPEFSNTPYRKFHNYTLPSGKIIKLQGFESKALEILLSSYNEEDILFKKSEVPEIWYLKSYDNKWHRYFCDFYIPKDNLIVEVKSKYTYEKDIIMNLDKQNGSLWLGFNFIFIVL